MHLEGKLKRRTLDIIASVGAVALAALLLILGLILNNRADFANDYVRDELSVQDIAFPAATDLNETDRAFTEARSGCVLDYAGQQVTTGRMGECYATEFLGSHLSYLATRLGMESVADVDGMSYTRLGAEQGEIRAEIAGAEADGAAVDDLEQRLEDVTFVREKMFEGTMLRNALLTSYGFGEFGTTADRASEVSFIVAGVLFLLAIAGFVHAFLTPGTKGFAVPSHSNGKAHTQKERREEEVVAV